MSGLLKTALQRVVTGADGPSIQSAPVPIPARATSAQDTKDDPPSPTGSISGDKYILVRAPKPEVRNRLMAEAGVKADIVKSMPSALQDQKSALCTTLSLKGDGVGMSRGLRPKVQSCTRVMPFSFSCQSAASGITTSVISIFPDANTTEWAAFVALYDEFRLSELDVHFQCMAISPAGGTGGISQDSFAVMAYDPTNSGALSSVRQGTEYDRHILLVPSPVLGTATSSATMKYGFLRASGTPHVLHVKLPSDRAEVLNISSSNTVVSSPGQWKSLNTSGSNNPDGFIKVYNVSDNTTAAITFAGVVYCTVQFRQSV